MIIHGLHHSIAMKRHAAGELARQALACSNPRDERMRSNEAERLVAEAEDLAEHAKGNEEWMENANKLLHYLATSPHTKKSRYRNLAITDLERAICWLHRENGDPEELPAYLPEPEQPVNGHEKH